MVCPCHDPKRVVTEAAKKFVGERRSGCAAVMCAQCHPYRREAKGSAASIIGDRKSIPAEPDFMMIDQREADAPRPHDDDSAIPPPMGAYTSDRRVIHVAHGLEWMGLSAQRFEHTLAANSCQAHHSIHFV
jgi:hypothetical protein